MRVRNWLLTGTSIALLAAAPMSAVQAQDAGLKQAFQAFQADPSDANKQKLNEACIAAGYQTLDECIAAVTGTKAVEQTPADQPSKEAPPPPSSEAAAPPPPSSEEPPPPPKKNAEAPAADATPATDASSEATPPPASEQPAPSSEQPKKVDIEAKLKAAVAQYNKGVAELTAGNSKGQARIDKAKGQIDQLCSSAGFGDAESCLAQYGLALDPLPAAPPPAAEPKASSEPAASSAPEAAPAAVASSEQPPASSEAPASSEQPKKSDAVAKLSAAADLYNQGVAELDAGNAKGQAKVDKAKGQIDKICAAGGFADTAACLEQFGLTLNPLPPKPSEQASSEAPASSAEQPAATSSEPPATSSEAAPSSEIPVSQLPAASEEVTPSAVEVLPPDVSSEAAPILDSAKDQKKSDQGQASSSEPPPADQTPPPPPPKDDKSAQADITPPPADQQSTTTEQGTKRADFTFVQPTLPPDVKVVDKPKNDKGGFVFQIGINIFINNPEQERDRYYDAREDQIYYEDLSRGRTRETIVRPNGVKIVTIYNRNGDVLQRSKILPDGREIYLASYDQSDEQDLENWRDPGDDLPPLRLNIPASDYILDADEADESQVELFLDQPPVEQVRRIYSIDEVKRSARLRDSVRRLEVGGLTFDTGKATISRDQVDTLSKVADAMVKMLDKNPGEVFLIEGHTDAVGSDVSNLVLSDQRAATVARILTDFYEIPAENLVTQGYGERYLKVQTDGPEPLNRRVTIKRITPLVTYETASN